MKELTPTLSCSSSSSFTSDMKERTLALSNSSSSSSFTCHSSSTYKWTYDVFLNFRGEDTRNGFTGYLYHALREKGIHTFIDDRLERGEEITPALLEAIDKSRIAIVILSVNYASSTFCLEELVKIFECTKQKNRLLLPIFYKVDPSDVRHIRGSYRKALVRHEKRFKNNEKKVQNWKSALREVANLSGWHFNERYKYEYEFIKKIVEEISKRIDRTPLYVAKCPIGLESRVEKIVSLLDLGSNKEIIMVGIHGIGGIGKTTIASAVYNVIVDQFESACFLSDVRERSYKDGLVELQKTLLSELIAEKETKIENVRAGIPIMRRRLCQKKVLLILDDVNSEEQLEAIAGGVDWFGFGSRIIMTTRDKHLLDVHDIKRHYEVKELCFEDALELFRRSAFKKNKVDSRYTSIMNHATNYCNGLPLALEIIGSSLFGKTIEEWKSALDIYEKIPNKNVQDTLKFSYTNLGEKEQEIFLDIACFFNGNDLSIVKRILLNGRGYDPTYCIGVLEKKSLIRINEGQSLIKINAGPTKIHNVKIHDLIAQMGREIVRSRSPSNPENWSRLWSYKDILSILEEDKGSDKIEFLMLNMLQNKEVSWNGEAFRKMKNLKILIIENACFSCEPKYLPNSLRVLEWKNYSWSSLPSHFHPRSLGILNLYGNSLVVAKPLKIFESLTEMNLSRSQFLEQVGDISEAANLRRLDISECEKLIEVHQSVGLLHKLVELNASGCTRLSKFPCSIQSASLEFLELTNCVGLQSVPQIPGIIENQLISDFSVYSNTIGRLGRLSLNTVGGKLSIDSGFPMLPKLQNWTDGIQHFNKFSLDDQENASSAMSAGLAIIYYDRWPDPEEDCHLFPTSDWDLSILTNIYLSVWRPYYCHLTQLCLKGCNLTDEFFYQRLPWFPSLVYLNLSRNRFTFVPEYMNRRHLLRTLIFEECKDLEEIKGIPPNIKFLSVGGCTSLTSQSSKILLSQAFHEDRSISVIVPGFEIPKWLDHSCMGSSISFWFRNEIPRLLLWFASSASCETIHFSINGIEFDYGLFHLQIPVETPCIKTQDLHEWVKKFKNELKKDEWNHVIISLVMLSVSPKRYIHCMGVHAYKKEKGPNNVRFIDTKKFIISSKYDYGLDDATKKEKYSLKNKFCPFLDMRVCDSIYSHKAMERLYLKWNDRKNDAANMPIWIMLAPTKVKFLLRRILSKYFVRYHYSKPKLGLPTCCALFKKKLVKSPMCPICETKFEIIEHVFFECSWTRPLWFGCDLDWTIQDRWTSDTVEDWLVQKFQRITKIHPNGKSVTGLMGTIMWVIWKVRNEFVLEDKPVNPLEALMTVKAMHMQYSSKASNITAPPENMEAAEVEHNVKPKGEFFSINEMEPTCDKGIEVKNKAKREREGESNSNTEMEPNYDKVFESTQVYKEPTSQEIDDKQNTNIPESQEEEANPVKKKGKYIERTTFEFDNVLPKMSTMSSKSIIINPLEPYKKFNAVNFDTIGQEIQEEIVIAPTQEPINEIIEDPIDLNYIQEIKQMVTATKNQNFIDVVNYDFDPFENLESILSGSSPLSLKSSSHIVSPSAIQQEEINKAIEGIEDFLNKNLEDILANSVERAIFYSILTILEKANDKEISVELKAFIVSLKESVAKILNQYSLCEMDVRAFTKLEVEKQEIQKLGQVGKKEMEDINNEIFECKTVVESYTTEIFSLEQQLFALQQKLADAKACHQTNIQKMSTLQAKRKNICENAKNLLERGKKVMQSKDSLQSKHDEALHQQASLEKEWTILKKVFLVNKLKFKN